MTYNETIKAIESIEQIIVGKSWEKEREVLELSKKAIYIYFRRIELIEWLEEEKDIPRNDLLEILKSCEKD
jgi:hypothetical protein